MLKKSILFYSFLFFLIIVNFKSNISLWRRIFRYCYSKINKMEKVSLRSYKESGTFKNNDTANISNDTIASHEKRLLDLEEELGP